MFLFCSFLCSNPWFIIIVIHLFILSTSLFLSASLYLPRKKTPNPYFIQTISHLLSCSWAWLVENTWSYQWISLKIHNTSPQVTLSIAWKNSLFHVPLYSTSSCFTERHSQKTASTSHQHHYLSNCLYLRPYILIFSPVTIVEPLYYRKSHPPHLLEDILPEILASLFSHFSHYYIFPISINTIICHVYKTFPETLSFSGYSYIALFPPLYNKTPWNHYLYLLSPSSLPLISPEPTPVRLTLEVIPLMDQ